MYFYVYQITNLVNGKIYVGKHKSKTHPLENGYYGSGKLIQLAIKKYGIDNFKKEILHSCGSLEEMAAKELEIVTEAFVRRKDTYNMHKGGNGGFEHINNFPEKYREIRSRNSSITGKRDNHHFKDPEWQKQNNSMRNPEIVAHIGKLAQTPEARKKRLATLKEIKHSQGENNSQFGKYWISNIVTKEVKRILSSDEIPEGWVRGKKGFNPQKCWVNNEETEKFINIKELDKFLNQGFKCGRRISSMPQNRIVV